MRTFQSEHAEAPASRRGAPGTGCARVVALSSASGSTIVTVRLPGGSTRDLVLAGSPDPGLARRLTAGFRRLGWVRIDLSGHTPRCLVSGTVRHPHTQQLPLAAALALTDAGIPGVVRLSGAPGS